MNKAIKGTALASVFVLIATSVAGADFVRQFRGSDDRTTPEFTVEPPWILDWRLDGDYDQLVALDVSLIEAKTGRHIGQVLHTKRKGNGVRLFEQGGTFQFRVSGTLARWTLKVQELSPEEAERYTRK
jgi:hypothetical protein